MDGGDDVGDERRELIARAGRRRGQDLLTEVTNARELTDRTRRRTAEAGCHLRGTAEDSSRGSSSTRRELKSVPAIARPTLPPSCWNRVRLLVAVPICRGATAPCTTSAKIENIGPTPRPVMNIHAQRTGSGVSARRFERRNRPIASVTAALSASSLYRPVRATIWPDAIALMMSPPRSARIW